MINVPPEPGKLVRLRGRPAVIEAVQTHKAEGIGVRHLVSVEYLDEHDYPSTDTILWEAEPDITVRKTQGWPDMRGTAPDDVGHYNAFLDAIRWTSLQSMEGYVVKDGEVPLISPWSAAVQVEDYQLVPLMRALSMPRVSLLLADDVGLGKTIQAGLIATELMLRRGIRRTLIVCPASLQRQWQEEMRNKFHLDFVIMDSDQIRRIQLDHGSDANPWTVHPRAITSMDFLKQDLVQEQFHASADRLQSDAGPARYPWDLLIVDEAHNTAPRGSGDASARAKMMGRLTFRFEHRLFLTATPHDGYRESFSGLLELVDPEWFTRSADVFSQHQINRRNHIMVRRLKRDINESSSTKRFPDRELHGIPVAYAPEERALFEALRNYRDNAYKTLEAGGKQKQNLGQFLFSLLMKRLLSSTFAFAKTWWSHVNVDDAADETEASKARARAEEETGDDAEQADRERMAAARAGSWLFSEAPSLRRPADVVSEALRALGWDEATTQGGAQAGIALPDGKWDAVLGHIKKGVRVGDVKLPSLIGPPTKPHDDERLLLFTEYRDTQELILARLEDAGYKGNTVRTIYGGMSSRDRDEVKELFNHPESKLRILLATDAASEGLNLQKRARYVAHYEIPWNPMRLEQRNGRVDRHGQPKDKVFVFHYNSREDEDDAFLERVMQKVHQAREDLGSVEPVIDGAIRQRLVLGRQQMGLSQWQPEETTGSLPADLLSPAPPSEDYHAAERRFRKASQAYGLDEAHIHNMLQWFLTRRSQCALVEGKTGWEIRGAKGKLKKMVQRHLADAAGNLPTLVFDAEFYMQSIGDNRRVYQPVYGTQLMRIGHPVVQAAMSHYRRSLWNPMDSDLRRWTVSNIPGNEAYVRLDVVITVRNELQEIVHSRVDHRLFHVSPRGLTIVDEDLTMDSKPAPKELAAAWQDRLGQSLLLSEEALAKWLDSMRHDEKERWVNKLELAGKEARSEIVGAFSKQIKELQKASIDQRKSSLLEALEREKNNAAQKSLSAEVNAAREQKIKEYEDQLRTENLNVWARNQQIQADRLKRENERFIEHILPKRYALGGDVEVVEVGIHAFVPGGNA